MSKVGNKALQQRYPNIIFEKATYTDGYDERRRSSIPLWELTLDDECPHFSIPLGPNETYRKVINRINAAVWAFRARPGKHVWTIQVDPLIEPDGTEPLGPKGETPEPKVLGSHVRLNDELRQRIKQIRIRRLPDDPNAPVPGTIRKRQIMRPTLVPPQHPPASASVHANPDPNKTVRIDPHWRAPPNRARRPSPAPLPELFNEQTARLLAPPKARRRPAPSATQPATVVRTRRPLSRG